MLLKDNFKVNVTGCYEHWPLFHFGHHHLWPNLASSILKFCRRKRSFQWYPDQWKTHSKYFSLTTLSYSVGIVYPCFLDPGCRWEDEDGQSILNLVLQIDFGYSFLSTSLLQCSWNITEWQMPHRQWPYRRSPRHTNSTAVDQSVWPPGKHLWNGRLLETIIQPVRTSFKQSSKSANVITFTKSLPSSCTTFLQFKLVWHKDASVFSLLVPRAVLATHAVGLVYFPGISQEGIVPCPNVVCCSRWQ